MSENLNNTNDKVARPRKDGDNKRWSTSRRGGSKFGKDNNQSKGPFDRPGNNRRNDTRKKEDDNIKEVIITMRRVTRVMAGGRKMSFSVALAVGDGNGRIGFAMAKGRDVQTATQKASRKARRSMFKINIKGETIPFDIEHKFCASRVLIKPAGPGTGVIAGGSLRKILELSGIGNILSKCFGSRNPVNTAYATIEALRKLSLK